VPIAISERLRAAGEENGEERNQANDPIGLEAIPEAIPSEQREKMKMGNLVNSFMMLKISIN
jgi:hypothetical protein